MSGGMDTSRYFPWFFPKCYFLELHFGKFCFQTTETYLIIVIIMNII